MSVAGTLERTPAELIAQLGKLQGRFETSARNLPELEALADLWQGLAFSVAGVRLVSAMTDLNEMLAVPKAFTRVPGANPWVLGIANIRGTLLPITDLQAYLGEKPLVPNKSNRILVVRHDASVSGLLVASVMGMKQFRPEQRTPHVQIPGIGSDYVYDVFEADGEFWPVFDMYALVNDPRFTSAAA